MVFDDTKLVAALEPNFRYKVIIGGPSPQQQVLPWPHLLPEKGFKVAELMEEIMKQYTSNVELPNLVKLAVLVLQNSQSHVGAIHLVGAYVGHAGPEWNQYMVDQALAYPEFLLLSAGIDGHPKDAAWRNTRLVGFLNGTLQWIALMDTVHQSKSLNMAALIGSSPKHYGRGVVDPGIFAEIGVAKHHWTVQHIFADSRVDALSHADVLAKVWGKSGQSHSGAATVLWHFNTRVLKFSTVKNGEKSFGNIHCLLTTHERIMLLGQSMHYFLNVSNLHHITRRNQIGCHVGTIFLIASADIVNPHRAQSMMAECAIGQLRSFQKEFTANDLIMCAGRLAHLLQAVEMGGLHCKGQPACVYGKFLDDAQNVITRQGVHHTSS